MSTKLRIRNEDIAIVRDRSLITEILAEYLERLDADSNLKERCPFHGAAGVGFAVSPARGMWFCRGCGEGGDVVTLVQRVEGVSFSQAMEQLAARAGVELRYERHSYAPRKSEGRP